MVMCAISLASWEAEAGESLEHGLLNKHGQHSQTLSEKQTNRITVDWDHLCFLSPSLAPAQSSISLICWELEVHCVTGNHMRRRYKLEPESWKPTQKSEDLSINRYMVTSQGKGEQRRGWGHGWHCKEAEQRSVKPISSTIKHLAITSECGRAHVGNLLKKKLFLFYVYVYTSVSHVLGVRCANHAWPKFL